MTISMNRRIGAALCRGLITSSILAAALVARADETDTKKPKDYTSTTQHATRGDDAASCLKEAATLNMTVIQVSELASQKAQNPELKRFSQTLQADHKKAQAKLETIAKAHNVILPTSLDEKCEAEISKLRNLSGESFDKEFAKSAIEGHAMAVAHLQQASTQAKDSDVAQYTKDMLARVKEHQQQAREVAKAVGLDQTTIASIENQAKESAGSSGATTETSTGSESKNLDKPDHKQDK